MPDRLIDLFIRFAVQNKGKLSENKRETYFHMLAQEEIQAMEKVVEPMAKKSKV